MKILFVAMASSVHTARWIAQIKGQPWRISLYPSLVGETVHKAMTGIPVHAFAQDTRSSLPRSFFGRIYFRIRGMIVRVLRSFIPELDALMLRLVIRVTQPDVIHSLETQGAGYLVARVKARVGGSFPLWIHTNWGSDIFIFGRMKEHEPRIRQVMENCNFYSCECIRDVELAREFGFKGTILPVFPNTGGFDLSRMAAMRARVPTSLRKRIMVKGNQGWAGRALVALRAIERCADILTEYEIVIYSGNSPEVQIKAALLESDHNLKIRMPAQLSHEEILDLHAGARISIGLSLGDAISTSFLEAMVAGSFPIQSGTACANEWIQHGIGGILLDPEDPEKVEEAIRRAIADDELVDFAASSNWETALARLNQDDLLRKTVDYYESVQDALVETRDGI